MKTLRISVDQISEYSFLEFGERGENAVTEVILDFAAWVEEFGEGIVNLYVKRGGDTSAYPVPLFIDGTVATWLVSETDTYKKGRGEAEYVYVVGEKIEKTAVFGFYVNRDIGQPSTTPPSPYETWMDSLMELSNTTLKNAQDAENSAEKAETAAQHYPVIIDGYWWVWRVEEEAYVNTEVKAEGQGFTIKGTVATVDDLPSDAAQGDFWNVGTHDPYTIYMYQDGDGWVGQGTLKGETGTTFTPSVSEEGVISWTNDGELPNPEPRNIRGPKGIQGDKGDTGDAAGFGQPTATVNQTTGQASVEVSASGPDTAKVFNFAFSGIKGERGIQGDKGDTGDAAGFGQPTASVDANVGTPSVTVTSSGPDTAKVFDFQFKNIKGNKGDTGNGITSVALVSTSGLDKTYRITFTESNPVDFVVHDGRGISSVTLNNDYTLTINFTDGTSYTTDRSIRGEKGETGDKGDTGDPAGFGTPTASVDANSGTPSVTVSASGPNTAKVFNFQFKNLRGIDGRNGDKGDTGNGISGISLVSTSGLDKTYRVTFTDSSPFDFVVHDGRGISSVVLNADYTLTINFTDGTNYTTTSIRGEKGETGEPGKNFTVEDYVDTPAELPSGVDVGTVYGVGTSEPYDIYIYSASQGWVNNGTIQGPSGATGTTFTPTVSSAGVISWTNDGGLPNPSSVNIKGQQGDKGETGEAAGFGTPTATVDQTTGQASVSVSASGPDTAKVFNFAFSGIKGEQGTNGTAAGFGTPTASVDANVGTPSVTITSSGPNTAKVFDFQFKNLKGVQGEKGEDGDAGTTFTPSVSSAGVISWTNDGGLPNPSSVNIKGQKGDKGDTGDDAGFGTPTASVDANVGTPSVTVSASGPNTAKVFDFQFKNLKGVQGEKGDDGTIFTPSVSSEGVISWTNNGGKTNPSPVNIRGPQGPDGDKGETGDAAGFGTPAATVGTGTGTPSVSVTASGPDTAKVFSFAFDGLKGTPGANGEGVPTGGTAGQFLKKSSGTDFDTEWGTVEVPTKVSDLTNDTGFITGMTILSYGSSTWQDFLDAFNAKKVVYCRASSNSNPATGSQGRMAFMAFVNFSGTTPTSVEFQYYRSVSSHTAAQQGDQVFIYKLESNGAWSVTTREASSKIVAGTNMSSSYSSGTLTLNATDTTYESKAAASGGTDLSLVTTGEKYNWNTRGIPSGGTTGQVLKKSSGSDYATEWADESGGGGSLKVTITDRGGGIYAADKTFAEINTAYQNGSHVFAISGNDTYQLSYMASDAARFKRIAVSSTVVTQIEFYMSASGTIFRNYDRDYKTFPIRLELANNGSYEYQDSPTGPFSVYTGVGDIGEILIAVAAGNNNDDYLHGVNLVFGYDSWDTGSGETHYAEFYRCVSALGSYNSPDIITLTFQTISMRSGAPVIKTVTISDESSTWDSLENATVTYSETALAVQS